MNKRLVSVTASKDYDDYLSECLPSIVREFDDSYVVVPPGSKDEEVAASLGAKTIAYLDWTKGEMKFNRAGAIRAAQELLHADEAEKDTWIAVVDADIYMPRGSSAELRASATLRDSLVGVRRIDAATMSDLRSGSFTYYPHLFSGYFQMYCRKDVFYEELWHDASITDCLFRDKFNVWVTAEVHCIHLGQQYTNWAGRSSPRWHKT